MSESNDARSNRGVDRGERWFDCAYCNKTFKHNDLNTIRERAVRHLNEKHGDQLSRHLDLVEREERGGHQVHENTYQVERVGIYLTKFDILSPIRLDGYVSPSDADSVCDSCGVRITIDSELEKVEKEPDSHFNDDWECSTCIHEQDIQNKVESNKQITEFTA